MAAGNWGAPEAVPYLAALLQDPSPPVRGHAAWALGRIGTSGAHRALEDAAGREADTAVQEEIELAKKEAEK